MTMNGYVTYELARVRQQEMLRGAEQARLAAYARRENDSLREQILLRLGTHLMILGARLKQSAQRSGESAPASM